MDKGQRAGILPVAVYIKSRDGRFARVNGAPH